MLWAKKKKSIIGSLQQDTQEENVPQGHIYIQLCKIRTLKRHESPSAERLHGARERLPSDRALCDTCVICSAVCVTLLLNGEERDETCCLIQTWKLKLTSL